MDANQFWLIVVEDSLVTVALISRSSQPFSIVAIGASQIWQESEESLITAVDDSLSDCAILAHLTEDQEPFMAALVVPPTWVGPDSRIIEPQHQIISHLCKQLQLRPMGFISSEEAIVEEANARDGVPASFISLHLSPNTFSLSLVYLGKIKQFISHQIDPPFTPNLVETALVDFQNQSALPPIIYVWGQVDSGLLQSLQEYPWVSKKAAQTFLHLPEIINRPLAEMTRIFAHAIVFQIDPGSLPPPAPPNPDPQIPPPDAPAPLPTMTEVTAQELGFGDTTDLEELIPPVVESQPVVITPIVPQPPRLPRISLTLPKFHLRLPQNAIGFIPLLIIPLISFFVLMLLSTAQITIHVTPIDFQKDIPVTLSTNATNLDVVGSLIPVTLKTTNVTVSESLPATGKKTVGNRAKGEIVIFNKQEKTQLLPKGSILVDDVGHKFELIGAVQIASSSSDLNQGIITLGQVKTLIQAADIGPEFNIATGLRLTFKDLASTQLIAKTNQTLTGGTRQEMSAVSILDKQNLEVKINDKIKSELNNQMTQKVNQTTGLINDSIIIKKSRVDYNREVGEESNELSADTTATITALIFDNSHIPGLISGFLSTDPNYARVDINPALFTTSFKVIKMGDVLTTATMTIKGSAQPKIDLPGLQKLLAAKGHKFAKELIRNKIDRAYNIVIDTQPAFLEKIDLLPFLSSHIHLIIQSSPL